MLWHAPTWKTGDDQVMTSAYFTSALEVDFILIYCKKKRNLVHPARFERATSAFGERVKGVPHYISKWICMD